MEIHAAPIAYSVEATVYLAESATGRGIGTRLYQALIAALKPKGIHGIIGGVSLPQSSERCPARKARLRQSRPFQEVGWKFEKWIDVGYWELLL